MKCEHCKVDYMMNDSNTKKMSVNDTYVTLYSLCPHCDWYNVVDCNIGKSHCSYPSYED